MSSLNEALEDLGRLRVRSGSADVDLKLSPAESRECIEVFISLMNTMVVPDIFASSIDINLLRALPAIINSPYVNVEPGVQVLYYNALYYGLQQQHGPGSELTHRAYLKVLGTIPAWLEVSSETKVDGHTAALTAWTCINNHGMSARLS